MKVSEHLILFSVVIFVITLMTVTTVEGMSRKEGPVEQPAKQQEGSGGEVVNEPKTFVKLWWPHVVGLPADKVCRIIQVDLPWVNVVIVRPSERIIPDYDPRRVRVFVDSDGIVVNVPIIG